MEGLTWINWIVLVELPVLGAMAIYGLSLQRQVTTLQAYLAERVLERVKELAEFKLDVSKQYASKGHLIDVEQRLEKTLGKLDQKLDRLTNHLIGQEG